MYQTMHKAAKDVEECKEMLVNMQGQLDRMEEKQEEMVRNSRFIASEKQEEVMQDGSEGKTDKKTPISSIIKKFGWNSSDDGSDDEEDEEDDEEDEEEEEGSGERRRIALVAMGGAAILIGGALHHHLG